MFTHESHICCRREASVMHNLEDLIGGHIMGAGPFLVAWRKDQTFLLVAYHLFFLEILNYSLSLYIYIYTYIYIPIHMCVHICGLGKRWLERGQGFGTNDLAYHLSKGYSVAKKCHAAKFRMR